MSRLKKALDGRDSHIWTLRLVIGILVIVVAYSLYGWKQSPERIKIDIPPDLRSGSTRGIEERHPFNVYAFGFYIFQQMNNWPVQGVEDYKERIRGLSCYFTPSFKGWLERDYERRMKRHELSRTRYIQEMPERPYNPKRVYKESPDNWVTFFDVNVKETFRAETVKDIFVRFPVRVVRWDVNPECNMWGLALDGFYRNPSRLEGTMQDTEELAQANTNQVAAE
tara:strand:+ start:12401 stop:13072 length:672 start_codon:yes stop_codon:yes gene_type:complete